MMVIAKKTVTAFIFALLLNLAPGAQAAMVEPLPALPPIPSDNGMTAEKIELGKMLFFDPRLQAQTG
jgi:cytochrome c peroxidase